MKRRNYFLLTLIVVISIYTLTFIKLGSIEAKYSMENTSVTESLGYTHDDASFEKAYEDIILYLNESNLTAYSISKSEIKKCIADYGWLLKKTDSTKALNDFEKLNKDEKIVHMASAIMPLWEEYYNGVL